jgi:phosphoribosylformimino-5-aminoimidazole carboxamide ribotide isomerase
MIIFPAMDLKDGKCVRLYQGEVSTAQVVAEEPIDTALQFLEKGAEYIHMVDLDGALQGKSRNLSTIAKVSKEINVPLQLGGGIRSLKNIEETLHSGVSRVILGTAALNNPNLVKEAVREFKGKIAIGIDARDGFAATEGWTKTSVTAALDLAKTMEQLGVETIIYTDISRDGTLKGPNLEATDNLNQKVGCNVIASGGIKDIEDIKVLTSMKLYGAIIGKALYSSRVSLKMAIAVGKGEFDAY